MNYFRDVLNRRILIGALVRQSNGSAYHYGIVTAYNGNRVFVRFYGFNQSHAVLPNTLEVG